MKFTKEKTIIALGVLLVLLPLTGFPRDWKNIISVLIGFVIIYMGTLLYRLARHNTFDIKQEEVRTETFTETV